MKKEKKLTWAEKQARRLTKEIYNKAKKASEYHKITVDNVLANWEFVKIEADENYSPEFTRVKDIAIWSSTVADENITTWYNYTFSRNEIYQQILYFCKKLQALREAEEAAEAEHQKAKKEDRRGFGDAYEVKV